jgi:hypothetical protein
VFLRIVSDYRIHPDLFFALLKLLETSLVICIGANAAYRISIKHKKKNPQVISGKGRSILIVTIYPVPGCQILNGIIVRGLDTSIESGRLRQ